MPFAGDPVYAADLNALAVTTVTKTSATGRSSTTTYAADPELTGIPLSIGTYEVDLLLFYTLTTTATQKIKTMWTFTGTWNNPIRGVHGPGSAATSGRADMAEMQVGAYAAGTDVIYAGGAGGGYMVAFEKCRTVTVTAVGTMSLSWAQSVSSANATTVQPGSSFTVRRIA